MGRREIIEPAMQLEPSERFEVAGELLRSMEQVDPQMNRFVRHRRSLPPPWPQLPGPGVGAGATAASGYAALHAGCSSRGESVAVSERRFFSCRVLIRPSMPPLPTSLAKLLR